MVKLLSGVVFQIRAMSVGFLNKTPTQIKSRVIKLFILMVPYQMGTNLEAQKNSADASMQIEHNFVG